MWICARPVWVIFFKCESGTFWMTGDEFTLGCKQVAQRHNPTKRHVRIRICQNRKMDQKNVSCAIYLLDFLEFPFFTMSNAIPTYFAGGHGFHMLALRGDLEISCV